MRKVRTNPFVFLFSFCQPFVDFKQLGNYFAFCHFLVEAVGGYDGAVVFLVGFAEFGRHYGYFFTSLEQSILSLILLSD